MNTYTIEMLEAGKILVSGINDNFDLFFFNGHLSFALDALISE